MANALQDGHCVFIGLSMTDVNLMRWLGARFCEVQEDKLSQQRVSKKPLLAASKAVTRALDRHYWIRPADADPTRFISSHLERRGVASLEIDGWGAPLVDLLSECFLDDSD